MIPEIRLRKLIRMALDEDIGSGDLTTSSVLTGDETGIAQVISKGEIIVAGIDIFGKVFRVLDLSLDFEKYAHDGQPAGNGEVLACVSGNLKNILLGERVALNILQRMCGIATMTNKYVKEVSGTGVKILDTRKTVPGLRSLDKYAVKTGGGVNHRIGLYDGVMIKDNHISASGGISNAIKNVTGNIPPTVKIEVEVKNLQEVGEALASGADIIMLDNMDTIEMKKAISLIAGKALVEASGNVTLSNVKEIAETGVDFISVGALTHSAPAADISLVFKTGK